MIKRIFLPLSLVIFQFGAGQNCTQDLGPILPEGEHVFKEIHFKHKGKEDSRIFPENLSYERHDSRINSVVPNEVYNAMVRNEFNDRKKAEATDMVIKTTGTHYKVVLKGDMVEFIPQGNKELESFVINCNTDMLIVGNRKIALKKEKVAVEHPDNIFKSQWEGYSWKFAKEKINDDVPLYNLTIAKIKNSGKTYIEIKTPDDLNFRLLSS